MLFLREKPHAIECGVGKAWRQVLMLMAFTRAAVRQWA